MDTGIIVALLLAIVVGVSLGLLGGGGSILAVPILTYVIGMPPKEAIASSLFIVGITSVVGLYSHARAQRVRWKTGVIFGLAAMAGAFTGGLIGGFINGAVLMILFAIMMIATATAMIRGPKKGAGDTSEEPKALPLVRVILDGALVGIATGLVGAGGGFLIVPALNLLGGLPMAVAVGTSLLVMSMKSFAGLAGYLFSVQMQWPIVLAFTAMAVVGSFIGSALAGRIPGASLRKGFGFFVLAMGAIVLVQEVPRVLSLFAGG
ncbi:MAG: sulfite exporter TauE/SafE family protein [Propionibacteriaceae bacterium]|nr:sulfite exporter TauE/SafE family protein [Propionibacteriaceae bacterium]